MNTSERKEKPVLFSTSMVSAVLAGRKTQTRRTTGLKKINEDPDRYLFHKIEGGVAIFYDSRKGESFSVKLPYGEPGGFLWVRETWRFDMFLGSLGMISKRLETPLGLGEIRYRADEPDPEFTGGWKPSIHMPRKISRINLLQQKVRVERLNDISEEDAISEGVLPNCTSAVFKDGKWSIPENAKCPRQDNFGCDGCKDEWASYPLSLDHQSPEGSAWESFRSLWESINGPGSWSLNPYVFVIDFEKVKS